jgi:RNA polymerase sigma factor (sigma-70 family)
VNDGRRFGELRDDLRLKNYVKKPKMGSAYLYMDGQAVARQVDELLARFLESTSEPETSVLLERLIGEHILPLIREIVRSNLRGARGFQDAEDVTAEVALRLLKKLRDLKLNPPEAVAGGFRGYVAVAAYNACYQYLRQEYPNRSRLKAKLRYALTRRPEFALWRSESRRWLCGFAAWGDAVPPAGAVALLRELKDGTQTSIEVCRLRDLAYDAEPARLLTAIFNWTGKPVEFDDLVDTVAHLRRVVDVAAQAVEAADETLADPRESAGARIEQRMYLQRLWVEISALPLRQRRALLLNLRDDHGQDLTTLLAHSRIATVREIAEALDMTAEEFAGIWRDLPLDDSAIAGRLGLTRQQIINLRLSARRRLARRLRTFEGPK